MAGNPQAAKLRDLLARREFILAPGVYDGISARVADRMGFPALYMTGYGATASMLGLPDAGLATYSDMLGRAEMICSVVGTPLIADADTGYGGLLNVQRTIRGYEAAGVAAIQIEDQEMPKKCGHTPGRRVVPAEDMALKLRVAADARRHEETLIVARTDARTALGSFVDDVRNGRFPSSDETYHAADTVADEIALYGRTSGAHESAPGVGAGSQA